mgnify:CR=1 FL=1
MADTPGLLECARAGDNDACAQLIEENTGLIWSIVRRYYGRGAEPEDLYQLGCLGFLKAVRGFDPAFGCQFSTYAVPKIAGEIRRFLRDDGTVKVSRSLKERAGAIRTVRERLSARLGREPTLSELAAETGLEPEEIAAAEEAITRLYKALEPVTDKGRNLDTVRLLDRDSYAAEFGCEPPTEHHFPAVSATYSGCDLEYVREAAADTGLDVFERGGKVYVDTRNVVGCFSVFEA